jgi:hypothetical protein
MNDTTLPTTSSTDRRRLVVVIGPPKTASTTLQSFFAQYASNQRLETKAAVFQNWNYPLFFERDDGLRELILHDEPEHRKFRGIQTLLLEQPPTINLLLVSEYLTHAFDDNDALDYLQNWTNATPEVVIMYRSPRMSHLISIWKQATQAREHKELHKYSFRDFVCSPEVQETVEVQLSLFANPLGLAQSAVGEEFPTYLLDMGGLDGQDVSHAFGCDILKVNCSDSNGDGQSWMEGLQGVTFHKNSRKGDPNVTETELLALENVFSQRDCTYRDELHNHPLFTVVRQRHLWEHCATSTSTITAPKVFPQDNNVTYMLHQMRAILGCAATTTTTTTTTTTNAISSKNTTRNDTKMTTTHSTPLYNMMDQLEAGGSLPNPLQPMELMVLQWMELVVLLFILLALKVRTCANDRMPAGYGIIEIV